MPHLEAVLAPWRHSLGSARWTFGDTLGDATADAIWALAQPAPKASPAAKSATSSAVLRRAAKRLFCSRIGYVSGGGGGQR